MTRMSADAAHVCNVLLKFLAFVLCIRSLTVPIFLYFATWPDVFGYAGSSAPLLPRSVTQVLLNASERVSDLIYGLHGSNEQSAWTKQSVRRSHHHRIHPTVLQDVTDIGLRHI